MLVTFESAVGRVTLFGNVAEQLLRMMGHSGTIPSAVLADDIPEALANLKQALAVMEPGQEGEESAETEAGNDEREARVSLRNRAFPLIRLLEDAARAHSDVMWEREGSAPLKF